MAITYVGVSNDAAAGSGDVSVTPPVTQTNDIMICAVTTHDNVAVTFPAGWTIYQEANNTTAMRATLAWKRCTGAEGAFTVTHTAGDGIVATAIVFRGCLASGSPINISVLTANASSSTCTAATITTTVAGCWLLFTMHDSDNGSSSAQSSANLGAMTERFDNNSNLGLDQAVSGAHVAQVSAGASGGSTGTLSLGPDINSGGNTFLAPAVATTQTVTKYGDGRVLVGQSTTKLADGRILKTQETTKLADGRVLKVQGITIYADGAVAAGAATYEITKYADGRIFKVMEMTKAADGRVKVENLLTKYSDGRVFKQGSVTKTADGRVTLMQSIMKTADGRVFRTMEITKTSMGRIAGGPPIEEEGRSRWWR